MTKNKDHANTNWLLWGVISGTILIVSPILIAVILSNAERAYNIELSSSGWIGSWGSYLGGISGTAGIIAVVYYQNIEQRRLNKATLEEQRKLNSESLEVQKELYKKDMDEQRKLNQKEIDSQFESLEKVEIYNRNRIKIEIYIGKLQEFHDELVSYSIQVLDLNDQIIKLYSEWERHVKNIEKLDAKFTRKEVNRLQKWMKKIKSSYPDIVVPYTHLRENELLLLKTETINDTKLQSNNFFQTVQSSQNLINLLCQPGDIDYTIDVLDFKKYFVLFDILHQKEEIEISIKNGSDIGKYRIGFKLMNNLINTIESAKHNTILQINEHMKSMDNL